MLATSTADRPQAVTPSGYRLPAMAISELRGYRRELERAIRFYERHHPAALALADMRDKRDKVQAEEDSRRRVGPAVRP